MWRTRIKSAKKKNNNNNETVIKGYWKFHFKDPLGKISNGALASLNDFIIRVCCKDSHQALMPNSTS